MALGEKVNEDPDFVFPQARADDPCPTDMSTSRHSGPENDKYMAWIRLRVPTKHSRDERNYCPWCDMKNHPRSTCKYLDGPASKEARHSCHLCIGAHPVFLCPRARCNMGTRQLSWAVREKKRGRDEGKSAPSFAGPEQQRRPPTDGHHGSAADTTTAADRRHSPPTQLRQQVQPQCSLNRTTASAQSKVKKPQMSGRSMSGTSKRSPRHFLNCGAVFPRRKKEKRART